MAKALQPVVAKALGWSCELKTDDTDRSPLPPAPAGAALRVLLLCAPHAAPLSAESLASDGSLPVRHKYALVSVWYLNIESDSQTRDTDADADSETDIHAQQQATAEATRCSSCRSCLAYVYPNPSSSALLSFRSRRWFASRCRFRRRFSRATSDTTPTIAWAPPD